MRKRFVLRKENLTGMAAEWKPHPAIFIVPTILLITKCAVVTHENINATLGS